MGFMFRVEHIAVTEENTILTGHMISGAVNWGQQVELQIEEDLKTVFTGPLRGVASAEDAGLTLFDPSLWEKVLPLPLSIQREMRIGLILGAIPPIQDLPVPALATGIDASAPIFADNLREAFQSTDAPAWSGVNFGTPMREYPYRISRRGKLMFAPWGLFFVTVVLSLMFVAFAFNKSPMQGVSLGKVAACGMLGFFDAFFLYLSIKMVLARPSPIIVTTAGIMMPVIRSGFSSHTIFVAFSEMDDVLEYWHNDAPQMLKVKTARGIFHLNRFLMQPAHFEELRRLLWTRIHNERPHAAQTSGLGGTHASPDERKSLDSSWRSYRLRHGLGDHCRRRRKT